MQIPMIDSYDSFYEFNTFLKKNKNTNPIEIIAISYDTYEITIKRDKSNKDKDTEIF